MPILLLQTPPPAALPDPSWLARYTVESPYPLAGLLVIGAVAALWMLNAQARLKLGLLVAAVLTLSAAGVVVAAMLVTTRREEVMNRTRDLISRAAAADTTALEDMLSGNIRFRIFGGERASTRVQVLDLVRQYPGGQYPVRSHSVETMQAVIDGANAARSQVRVSVRSREATMYDVPVGSWWRIEWRQDPDGVWRVDALECLQIDGARR